MLFVSQPNHLNSNETAGWNGNVAHRDKYTYHSFLKAQTQKNIFSNSWIHPSGKFANNYLVLPSRKASHWVSSNNCSLQPVRKWMIKSKMCLSAYNIPGEVWFKTNQKLICENFIKSSSIEGGHIL